MIFCRSSLSFYTCLLCLILSLNAFEQKSLPRSLESNMPEQELNGNSWEKLLSVLMMQNERILNLLDNKHYLQAYINQEANHETEDSDYDVDKRGRNLFLGKRAKPRSLFLG